MTTRKLFTPSPAKQPTKEDLMDSGRRRTRSSTKDQAQPPLTQAKLTGYSISPKKRRLNDAENPNTEPPAAPLSPSPEPPRVRSDFLQVTSPTFLESTKTPIEGVHYLARFIPLSLAREWYDSLLALPQWYRPTLKLYGREITQSRAIIAFSKVPNLKLKYSGTEVVMHDWPHALRSMETKCREVVGQEVRFNHAMLNYYPSGDTHIGRHSDNLENKVILTVSLGSPRQWVMTRRLPHGAKAAAKKSGQRLSKSETHRWTVEPGSLLLMQGKTQEEWYHEIPKQTKIKEGRISITFRQLVYE